MDRYKNEQGAALVLTLFIVTLLLLLVLTLFYQVTNTAKQVTTIEKTIDARNLANMGIEYYQQSVAQYDSEQPIEKFIDELPLTHTTTIDENRLFEITQTNIEPTIITSDTTQIIITFTSKGTAFKKEMVEKGRKITINIINN